MLKKQGFLTGWFGHHRPLNGIEIGNKSFNMNKTVMEKAMVLGFSQVERSQDVREYHMRGTQLSSKQLTVLLWQVVRSHGMARAEKIAIQGFAQIVNNKYM